MSLSRKQMLDEMGLSPQWTLREQPVLARREASARGIIPAALPGPRPAPSVDTQASLVESGPERAQHIAGLGWEQLRQSIADCSACGRCAQPIVRHPTGRAGPCTAVGVRGSRAEHLRSG